MLSKKIKKKLKKSSLKSWKIIYLFVYLQRKIKRDVEESGQPRQFWELEHAFESGRTFESCHPDYITKYLGSS